TSNLQAERDSGDEKVRAALVAAGILVEEGGRHVNGLYHSQSLIFLAKHHGSQVAGDRGRCSSIVVREHDYTDIVVRISLDLSAEPRRAPAHANDAPTELPSHQPAVAHSFNLWCKHEVDR